MSTRSIAAVITESGPVGVYVHSDGYPDGDNGRLAQLGAMIARDGASKVCETILSANQGGWSYMFTDYTSNSLGDDRAELIPGYGLKYVDEPASVDNYWTPARNADFWGCEYVYLIHPETGAISWAEHREDYAAMDWREVVTA